MSVVSVRLSDEDEAWLRERGLKPGTFARQAVHEAIRRLEVREARSLLDQHRVTLDEPTIDLIREDRGRP